MEKKEILLPSKKYFKADEQDLNLNVKLENDETLLREGDKDIVLNLSELFDTERNKSINYKILCTSNSKSELTLALVSLENFTSISLKPYIDSLRVVCVAFVISFLSFISLTN